MAQLFTQPVDIINRALQHCGIARVWTLEDATAAAQELAFLYDKLRRAELRRNVWKFSARRTALNAFDTSTYALTPGTWDSSKTYMRGHVVLYSGVWYESRIPANSNAQPDISPTQWEFYFGPKTANLWASGTSHHSGDLVYTAGMTGLTVWKSLYDVNQDTPYLYPTWSATATYDQGDTVIVGSQVPVYFGGVLVYGPGGTPEYFVDTTGGNGLWQSTQDLNINHVPNADAAWVRVVPAGQVGQMVGKQWLALTDASLHSIRVSYPLGSGPLSDTLTRNLFRLPNGFLRKAPQQPGQGRISWLGAPTGFAFNDWELSDSYIVSSDPGPLMFRFAADVQDVTEFDDMFCEGLAARLAYEAAPTLTDKAIDRDAIQHAYKQSLFEARVVNGIEEGSEEPVDDEYLTARL